ncbi:glycoside hydrolase family 3 N-terminal domain-containing protein [uncultured Tessaracoccus sp.]|uniref:glycoside hydrolase family 3 N-terminal domain-containing protein n=1 Tax=uncultured Tessaracoccus sp. TaxID=905023 RepID=UPI00260FC853|nr:glycoside hydrolase family 3 N-terminal domain-containing protein [uncultured Tessaracoccus sp.]
MAKRFAASVAFAAVLALSACAPAPIISPPAPNMGSTTPSARGRASAGANTSDPSATPEAPRECLAEAQALSAQEQVGQLLMVGVSTSDLDTATIDVLRSTKAGSVVLLGSSKVTRSDAAALAARVGALGAADIPMLVAADQEGGQVQRLQGQGFTRIPDAVAQGQMNETAFHAQSETWAAELARAGVRFNLAPVADVVPDDLAASNEPIGQLTRQYGSDPEKVADSVVTFVQSMQSADVATSLKHFPGLGKVRHNTDNDEATDQSTVVDDPSWKPFIDGIQAGASSVMISSATFEQIDPDHKAVFSRKIITDILRGSLGFDGVVISDDLGAAGAVADVPAGERAVRFLDAGGDLIINADANIAQDMAAAIVAKMDDDPEFAEAVAQSAARVLALKESISTMECG